MKKEYSKTACGIKLFAIFTVIEAHVNSKQDA